ncbi:MAG: hypothetical protein ACTSRG_24730 [Candidatus Helarchaeota archaeon]
MNYVRTLVYLCTLVFIVLYSNVITKSQIIQGNDKQIYTAEYDSLIINNQKEITKSIDNINKTIRNKIILNKFSLSIILSFNIILILLNIYLILIFLRLKRSIDIIKKNNVLLKKTQNAIQILYDSINELKGRKNLNIINNKEISEKHKSEIIIEGDIPSKIDHKERINNQMNDQNIINVKYSNEQHLLYKTEKSDYFYIKRERNLHKLFIKDNILNKTPHIIYNNEFKKVFKIDDKNLNRYKLIRPSIVRWNYSENNGIIISMGLIEK